MVSCYLRIMVHDLRRHLETGLLKVAAPRIWNILPKDIRKQDNYHIFKKQLKTYYFKLAYTNIGVY